MLAKLTHCYQSMNAVSSPVRDHPSGASPWSIKLRRAQNRARQEVWNDISQAARALLEAHIASCHEVD